MSFAKVLSLIVSYALVLSAGCKERRVAQSSSPAEVPTTESAYAELLGGDSTQQEAAKALLTAFRELNLHRTTPMVVVNRRTRTIEKASARQSLGKDPLKPGEELFFGKPSSPYLAGMNVLGLRKKEKNQEVAFSLDSYDVKMFRKTGLMNKREGVKLAFTDLRSPTFLKSEILRKMSQLNSFFNKPELLADFGEAQRAQAELEKQERNNRWYGDESKRLLGNYFAESILFTFIAFILVFMTIMIGAVVRQASSGLYRWGGKWVGLTVVTFVVLFACYIWSKVLAEVIVKMETDLDKTERDGLRAATLQDKAIGRMKKAKAKINAFLDKYGVDNDFGIKSPLPRR